MSYTVSPTSTQRLSREVCRASSSYAMSGAPPGCGASALLSFVSAMPSYSGYKGDVGVQSLDRRAGRIGRSLAWEEASGCMTDLYGYKVGPSHRPPERRGRKCRHARRVSALFIPSISASPEATASSDGHRAERRALCGADFRAGGPPVGFRTDTSTQ